MDSRGHPGQAGRQRHHQELASMLISLQLQGLVPHQRGLRHYEMQLYVLKRIKEKSEVVCSANNSDCMKLQHIPKELRNHLRQDHRVATMYEESARFQGSHEESSES